MGTSKFSNQEKAAIILLSLGSEIAGEIFRNLSKDEAKKLASAIQRLGKIDSSLTDKVLEDFLTVLEKPAAITGSHQAASLLARALGDAPKNLAFLEKVASARLDALSLYEPESLAPVILTEHPQTIALILAYCEPSFAAATLKRLPESLHAELLLRIANLEHVDPTSVEAIDDFLRENATKRLSLGQKQKGGASFAANVLSAMGGDHAASILEDLDARSPESAQKISEQMFTFADFIHINPRDLPTVLRETKEATWLIALRGGDEQLRTHILSGMSQRRRQAFLEDMAVQKPQATSKIEEARRELVEIVKKLIETSRIQLNDPNEVVV